MTELLDIDLDAMVRNCAGTSPGVQSICPTTLEFVRATFAATVGPRWFMDEHVWALKVWQELGIRSARVWHVDAHHDAYGSTDASVWSASLEDAFACDDRITSATFLLAAWRAGIVSEVVWLVPAWLGLDLARRDLERELGRRRTVFTIATLGTVDVPTRPAVITCAWSRRWVDPRLHATLIADSALEPAARAVAAGALVATF